MQPGDQPTTDETAFDTSTFQTSLLPLPRSRPLPIREFLTTDQPRNRLAQHGASANSGALAAAEGRAGGGGSNASNTELQPNCIDSNAICCIKPVVKPYASPTSKR
jgi:hypothetical protein